VHARYMGVQQKEERRPDSGDAKPNASWPAQLKGLVAWCCRGVCVLVLVLGTVKAGLGVVSIISNRVLLAHISKATEAARTSERPRRDDALSSEMCDDGRTQVCCVLRSPTHTTTHQARPHAPRPPLPPHTGVSGFPRQPVQAASTNQPSPPASPPPSGFLL